VPRTAPTKERKLPSKQRRTGSASSMDVKGGRTRREEGHEVRNHTKGGRTRREEGHKGREDMMKGGNVIDLYHLSLLPMGTFLATWLYTVRNTPDTRAEKN
jgi:hypothetical protein